jgi:hypothetical protein
MPHALDQLKRAKGLSDKRRYEEKNHTLRKLIQQHPEDFFIDSEDEGGIIGITHRPTNFRIHMQKSSFPTAHTIMKTARDVSRPSIFGRFKKQAKVELDLEVGDVILTGRFKNKRTVVEEIGTDSLGQPTVNGMKLLSMRLEKTMPPGRRSKETQEMDKQAYLAGYMYKAAADEVPAKMPSLPSMDVGRAVGHGRQAWEALLKKIGVTGDPRMNYEARRFQEITDYDRQRAAYEKSPEYKNWLASQQQKETDDAYWKQRNEILDSDLQNPPGSSVAPQKPAVAPWWLKRLSGINPELIDEKTGWSSSVDPKTDQRSFKQTSPEKSKAYEDWLQATPEVRKNPDAFEDHWTKRMEDTHE